MSVETTPATDGRQRVSLGPVERWAVLGSGTALLGFGFWLASSVQTLLVSSQTTSQQVANVQLQVQQLNTQMQDVAAVKLKVAELSIQVEQNKQDIHELKQLKGLK